MNDSIPDYDLLVIGAGSGGLAAAERAATLGARVAIAEQANTGGACVNYGCIPEKLLDYAASFHDLNAVADSYGWSADQWHFSWPAFIAAKDDYVQQLNQCHLDHLQEAGVQVLRGTVAFRDAHTVTVGDRLVTAEKILIAVGAKPLKPEIPGIEHTITWRELYHLPEQPLQLVIIGGDPIGVKVAGSLNELGSHVTQITVEPTILTGLDSETALVIQGQMRQRGVQFLNQTSIQKIERQGDHRCLIYSDAEPLSADIVLVDAQRVPNLADLQLQRVGIQLTAAGAIRVDAFSRTSHVNIFAVGDCTDRIPLTPSAIAQARAFVDTEFGDHPRQARLDWIPMSISSHPEAATVGLSEEQAREQFGEAVSCYRREFHPLFQSLISSPKKTFMKEVVNSKDVDRVLGIHIVGEGAVNIVQSLAIALKLGATRQDLNEAIGIHPSSAEELFVL